ncbi:putative ABC exporter domain-containing protein [Gorillibacterium timonense]|uniref:putative ABC exporter domain-containing protein n=1 Tax=Gorillibacterium timonense TaxID=1689269 RepID=UPI00071D6490|nr:putative ABC exporter domain-containing protein [Gorillibacterium timonense]
MRPLLYVMKKSFVNTLKELKRKPGTLILYLFLAAFFVLFLVLSFLPKAIDPTSQTADPAIYGMIVSGVILFIVYTSISKSIKSGNSFFRMADVNLAFTAPISPKKVLLYGFLKQIWLSFVGVFMLVWQIPNLRNHYEIDGWGIVALLFGFVMLLFLLQMIGVLIYSWTSRTKAARSRATQVWNGLLGLFGVVFLVKLMELKDMGATLRAVLHSKEFEYVPLIGWFKAIFMAPLIGTTPRFYIAVALVLAVTVLLMVLFYYQKSDYYEDVLANTEQKETLYAAKKAGKQLRNGNGALGKARKVKQTNYRSGAAAVFSRQLLEYRKRGLFLIDRSTILLAAFGFASQYFVPDMDLTILLLFSIYYLFILSFQGSWMRELERPYIYLIPAGSAAKLFYATLADLIKGLLDGLVLFVTAGIFLRGEPLTILLCALGYVTYSAAFTYSDVLFRRLFGPLHSKVVLLFLRMFLLLILIGPGVAIGFIARHFAGWDGLAGDAAFVSALMGYNLLLVSGIFAMARGIFDRLEMK